MSTEIYSNTITPTGFNASTSWTITGGTASINGGAYAASGTITPGQNITVKMTSSATTLTDQDVTVNIGGVTDTWTVTTGTGSSATQIVQQTGAYIAWNFNSASHTFTNCAIGPASTERLVVVAITNRYTNNRLITAVTIGGIAATAIQNVAADGMAHGLWACKVPTGTTANIAVSFSGSAASAAVGVWAVYNNVTTWPYASSTGVTSASCAVRQGGVVIASARSLNSSGTWTGVTQRYVINFEDGTDDFYYRQRGGDRNAAVSAGTATATLSGGHTHTHTIIASF